MDFFEHLDKDFAHSKEAFLYAIKRLDESKKIVINIGISSLSYNTGFLNIRNFKNFIKDVSELINSNSKRHVVVVVSDDFNRIISRYLQPDHAMLKNASDADSINKKTGYNSALIALGHNDIVNLFYDGFLNYNLRVIGFAVSPNGTGDSGELKETLQAIKGIVFSKSKSNDKKINDLTDILLNKRSVQKSSNVKKIARKTSVTLEALFRIDPRTVPIIMEDEYQRDYSVEGDDDGFAAKIAVAIDADVIVSISHKGMLYTADPSKNEKAEKIYCYNTSQETPFSDARKNSLGNKLNAAKSVTNEQRPITMLLTSYSNPYTVCNIFNKNIINGICNGGEFPNYTIFINSKRMQSFHRLKSIPIEDREITGGIIIDDNAEKALCNKNSLLSVGIIKIQGNFEKNAVVSIMNKKLKEIGAGVVSFSSSVIKEKIEKKESLVVINRTKMRIKKEETAAD